MRRKGLHLRSIVLWDMGVMGEEQRSGGGSKHISDFLDELVM